MLTWRSIFTVTVTRFIGEAPIGEPAEPVIGQAVCERAKGNRARAILQKPNRPLTR